MCNVYLYLIECQTTVTTDTTCTNFHKGNIIWVPLGIGWWVGWSTNRNSCVIRLVNSLILSIFVYRFVHKKVNNGMVGEVDFWWVRQVVNSCFYSRSTPVGDGEFTRCERGCVRRRWGRRGQRRGCRWFRRFGRFVARGRCRLFSFAWNSRSTPPAETNEG